MTRIVEESAIAIGESPAVGDEIDAGDDYLEHLLAHAGYAYHLGSKALIRYGMSWTDPDWQSDVDGDRFDGRVACVPLGVDGSSEGWGRQSIGPTSAGGPAGVPMVWEVRLRGSNVRARVQISHETGSDIEVELATDSDTPQADVVQIEAAVDDHLFVWIDEAIADPDHEEATLEALEVSPCAFGGDAPGSRVSWPPEGGSQSGMDLPRLTAGGVSCVASRVPIYLGSNNDGVLHWDTPAAGEAYWEHGSAEKLALYGGPSSWIAAVSFEAGEPAQAMEAGGAPISIPWGGLSSDPHAIVIGAAVRFDDAVASPRGILELADTSAGELISLFEDDGTIYGEFDRNSFAIVADPGGWIECAIIVHVNASGLESATFYVDGEYEHRSTEDQHDVNLLAYLGQLAGGNALVKARAAWPYLLAAPAGGVGTKSELLGHWRSWMGWRSLMGL